MTKREVIKCVLEGEKPPYVPWSFSFTVEAKEKLVEHYGHDDLMQAVDNHILDLGSDIGFFEDIGSDFVRDVFGVVWDRSIDKDIGNVSGCILPEPTLKGYEFPDPLDKSFFEDIPEKIDKYGDRFRVFQLGFSFFERAWTLRGMTNLLMDFLDHPDFVRELLDEVEALPGVTSAGVALGAPFAGGAATMSYQVEGLLPAEGEDFGSEYQVVSSDYFRTMGIPILEGRGL